MNSCLVSKSFHIFNWAKNQNGGNSVIYLSVIHITYFENHIQFAKFIKAVHYY